MYVVVCLCQELEKARAIIAARLASKDGNVTDPAFAANSSAVNAMSLIARGYGSASEEEEGEIERSIVKHMEKKAKLQKAIAALEEADQLPLTSSVSQALDASVQEASASLPADRHTTDDSSQRRSAKSESRSSDDHKSRRRKDTSRDGHDRDRQKSSKTERDRSHRDAKNSSGRQEREKDKRRVGDEKVSNSQGEADRRPSRKSHEGEATKELSQKSESDEHASSRDGRGDGHRQHSSRLEEVSRRHETERSTEGEKRHSDGQHSHSNTRQPSPDGRHMPSHSTDKKAER